MTALEADLGVRLLHRNTRRLVLTLAGEELHRRARRIVADAAWNAVRRLDDVPRGLLRVSASGQFLNELFVDFLREFPEVLLEVRATTRHVDLVAGGVDVAVRFGTVRDPNLIVRKVAAGRRVVVGTPAYLDARGRPSKAADLARHECIVGFAGEWSPTRTWPLLDGSRVRVGGRLAGNQITLSHRAALGGLGLALLPVDLVGSDVSAGRLEVVLEDTVGSDASVSVVYADREFIDPQVRVFVDRAVPVIEKHFATMMA